MVDEILRRAVQLCCAAFGTGIVDQTKRNFERLTSMYDHAPPHPGEILRDDILPSLGLTKKAFAKNLGISVQRLNKLLSERQSVTVDLAKRLGAVVGYGPRYWLGMQIQHDIWRAETEEPLRLKPIVWRRGKSRAAIGAFSAAPN